MTLPYHVLPGILGGVTALAVWSGFDHPDLAREIEALTAIGCAIAIWLIAGVAVPRAMLRESEIEKRLAAGGVEPERMAMRALEMAETARTRMARMEEAAKGRAEPLRRVIGELGATLDDLLEDTVTNPETAQRADDLLRRTLPRLEDAVLKYCAFARRGNGVVDTEDTRNRLIGALNDAGATADRARRAMIETSGDEVDVSLSVLESTLAQSR